MSNFQQITNTKLEEVKTRLDSLPASISTFDTHESKTSAQHLSELKNASVRGINNTGGIGDGSENHTSVALGYDRTAGQGRALLVGDDGRLMTEVLGNTEADGSGDAKHLHLDGNGNLLSIVSNTVNVAPANSANSHLTDDPANSVAVGLKGRTTIGTATTETFLLCDNQGHLQVDAQDLDTLVNASVADINNMDEIGDGSSCHKSVSLGYDRSGGKARALLVDSDGHLQVDIVSGGGGGGGGGDATSANQSTMITHLSEIEGAVETLEGCVSGTEVQVDVVSQPDKTHTFTQQTTSVLAPTGIDTQRITAGANIDLQSTREVSVVLETTDADAQADVNAQLEFSHDGTTFFTDLTGASAFWQLSSDIQGVSRGIYLLDLTLSPTTPKARYMRVIYNHSDNSGSDISITARIVQHAI